MTDLNLLDGGIRMANMSGGGGGFPAAAASPEEEMCNTMELWLNASAANGSAGGDLRRNMVNFSDMRDITYAIPVYGYVTPFLLMITFFTNAVVVAVLSRPHMKSPSNFILCAMAISDLCTLGIPVPMFIYQYTLGFHRYPVPCYLAVLDLLMTDILPTICHSASIWLTLMLAVQRYIYVCHPGKARIWCTIPRVTAGTVVIYSVAGLYNLPRLFERKFHSGYFPWECAMVNQCIGVFQEWAVGYYLPVFYWFRVICVNVLPCLSLVVLNTLLVVSLNEAQANRKRLFKERKQESSKQRDSNGTTMMLVAVVFVFLAVELPLACMLLIFIVQNTWELTVIAQPILSILITFSNLCIALSYSIYFPIYCSMSRQFRETFKELFIRAKQFTQETARNGVLRGSGNGVAGGSQRRRAGSLAANGCGTALYISTADYDEETFNRTIVQQVSGDDETGGGGGAGDPAVDPEAKESETLL